MSFVLLPWLKCFWYNLMHKVGFNLVEIYLRAARIAINDRKVTTVKLCGRDNFSPQKLNLSLQLLRACDLQFERTKRVRNIGGGNSQHSIGLRWWKRLERSCIVLHSFIRPRAWRLLANLALLIFFFDNLRSARRFIPLVAHFFCLGTDTLKTGFFFLQSFSSRSRFITSLIGLFCSRCLSGLKYATKNSRRRSRRWNGRRR